MFREIPDAVPGFLISTSMVTVLLSSLIAGHALAQETPAAPRVDPNGVAATSKQVADLAALVQKLQTQVNELEKQLKASDRSAATAPVSVPDGQPVPAATKSATEQQPTPPNVPQTDVNILRGTTVNFLLDGYYGYNFNNPIGRVNLLRAYDVSSNAFSLNQADVIFEHAADPAHGERFGLRLDLQYGQATAALQGNASNEPRPDVYRNIFQAYGTYVVPIGTGLTVDFGKWA